MSAFYEDREMLRDALLLTRQQTGFAERLIEKDYFCTLLLDDLRVTEKRLVFKGGTCLTKVHVGFYRLSEDLDFVIPTSVNAPRAERRRRAAGLKEVIASLPRRIPVFHVEQPLTGANNSTQYITIIGYRSPVSGQKETIKIEVGLREPLLLAPVNGKAETILLDPISRTAAIKPVEVHCISQTEAFAEKFRAALTRREVAIRDFYDLDYAIRKLKFHPFTNERVGLVRQKLAVPGNEPADVSRQRFTELQQQLQSQLKPVLRENDFREFDLERAFQIVSDMALRAA